MTRGWMMVVDGENNTAPRESLDLAMEEAGYRFCASPSVTKIELCEGDMIMTDDGPRDWQPTGNSLVRVRGEQWEIVTQ